ncbi:SspB-related isopeptide-forming adhesin [Streptococcus taonis]|uniref:LPXTG cell wall anchor domain-containing protein n=1 Tax=Streptococcus taonis TaxID=3041623 RepID=A0ABT6PCP5_9STRE|nr:SspB-related isopeptide-forming adhesin [Streptococcus sp. ST22-14]MDI1473743.1 LPXTG cell wall anchor domain-containing protein [Streptococcus sp. ST22-14]
MFKTQETKAFGSIRKMKHYGACGVILGMAALAMAFASGGVSADEVNSNSNVAVEKKAEFEVPISHEKLDKAVAEAKDAGVKVEVGVVQDKGVATTETVASKQKEVEADYVKQEKEVSKVTSDYSAKVDQVTNERRVIQNENQAKQKAYEEAVNEYEAEVKRIEAENKAILADNDKKKNETEAENARIERDNAKKLDDYKQAQLDQENANKQIEASNKNALEKYDAQLANYEKQLSAYNKQKEELAKKGLKAEKHHIQIYGDYDESQRGSVNYYKNLTASFEGVDDLIAVKDYIGLHSDTTISGSRAGLLADNDGVFAEIVNPKAGDSFTIHNIAESKDGKKISAKFTFKDVEAEWVKDGKSLSSTKIFINKDNGSGSINFVYGNLVQFDTKIDLFYEKTGKNTMMAIASVFNDIDYGQELSLTYQDGSEGIVLNPDGSEVKKVSRDGRSYYKGEYKTPWTYDVPELGVKKGDLGYAGVRDEADIPLGSILSVGYGSSLNFAYHNGRGVHNDKEIEEKRKEVESIYASEGKDVPSDETIFTGYGWAVGIFGKSSATVPVSILTKPPVKPELKQKDTKEIPKPKLEQPKKFVPRTTLPIPLPPTPPKENKIPEMPLVPTVKVNYSRLRVQPSTPKPVKDITDNFGNNIDGASTFDKNVNFRLTTDYSPYSTFTVDSKTYGKIFGMLDDVQDGAYTVDDSKITMNDSVGKDVKALFNMYHVLSEEQRTKEIQNILKEAGLTPKGEFYLWVAKDSASFYQNYVKQAKNITIDLPARLLVEKGQIVKNDFHQIDFGNSFVSNLVTVEVPDIKPEKHALDHKDNSKVRDGQEIQIGEYLRYLLDGVTVPAKHDTLYQYDGVDMLDLKHDRYTGNWSGVIRGTEYVAEKDLTLNYDVVLKDGKVVKAGDKISKGTAYAFLFEVNQDTDPNFLKKIVTVKWDEKVGKWSYVINQDFLNSLGVKGSFDADFYIEVERISAGKVENKFVNIINSQEMEAKVTTHTPEPEKPQEPNNPSLPNTGAAASSLGFVGTGILSMLGLFGLKRKKD